MPASPCGLGADRVCARPARRPGPTAWALGVALITPSLVVQGQEPREGPAPANTVTTEATEQLPEVEIKARRTPTPTELTMDPQLSRSTLGAERLARRQSASVFELLDELPGVAANGGPRASGMSFNIRGYSDNEDIAVKVDGVSKGFEKYRFGGTFIEPEMLKSLEVRRGAQIESAGALGGSVLATTRDAADLLRPGQRFGARTRLGYASNNDEQQVFATVYGRPSDTLDLVAAQSSRSGGDMTLPDGQPLSLSSVDAGSELLKASWFPHDEWSLSLSWLNYHDQALQAYDATGGEPGLFGSTQRRIDDETVSAQARWSDLSERHEARLVLGQAQTRVRDHFEPGMSPFANRATGDVDDDIRYRGHTLDASARIGLLPRQGEASDAPTASAPDTPAWAQGLDLRLGLQWGRQQRTSLRHAELQPDRYPEGYNPAQSPGQRETVGLYLQPDWRLGHWQFMPGLRWDQISVSASGPTVSTLQRYGQDTQVRYQHTSPSLVVSHQLVPKRVTLHAQWARAFRPPLIDELFSQSAYGSCNNASLSNAYTVAGTYRNNTPGRWNGVALAPASGICADLYELETSRSTELGLGIDQPDALMPGLRWQLRLSAFRNETQQLLESLQVAPNALSTFVQPGWERRHGVELETGLESARAFATLSYSRVAGQLFDGVQTHGLTTAPGSRLMLSLGGRWRTLEAVLRWQQVGDRLVVLGTDAQQRDILGTQEGYRLLGMSLRWQINTHFDMALSGDNLENTSYRLTSGFGNGLGTQAPGRNLRLSLSARY